MSEKNTQNLAASGTEIAIIIGTQVVGSDSVQTVNARDLHKWLGTGKMFSHWIKGRIAEYEFVEGEDFSLAKFGKSSFGHGGSGKTEYHITVNMAKELAMVERNEKGKQARRYFIECERRAKAAWASDQGGNMHPAVIDKAVDMLIEIMSNPTRAQIVLEPYLTDERSRKARYEKEGRALFKSYFDLDYSVIDRLK